MSEQGYVLLVEDEAATAMVAARMIEQAGWVVTVCDTGVAAQAAAAAQAPAVVLLDLGLPDISGIELLPYLRQVAPQAWMVVLTADNRVTSVVAAMQAGANDYLAKPIDRQRLLAALARRAEAVPALGKLAAGHPVAATAAPAATNYAATDYSVAGLVGASPAIRRVFREVEKAAPRDIPVLLHGESGTGKELLARALHDSSPRAPHPFVAVNCAAIPESLHEAELFGFEKGAFTGATHRQAGRFEQADHGTLFLDEVAELSLVLQAKLLRALQEQTFYRVGGAEEVRVDLRVVAATHRDLRREVEGGRFREDLFFRLAVFEIALPPLRERGDDLELIAAYLLERLGREVGRTLTLSEAARRALGAYAWPGNVRELRNCLYRACVMADGAVISLEHLPAHVSRLAGNAMSTVPPPRAAGPTPSLPLAPERAPAPEPERVPEPAPALEPERVPEPAPEPEPLITSLADQERHAILAALERHDHNMTLVAKTLGIGRTTLYRKLKRYGL